jgi:hypothetical protein
MALSSEPSYGSGAVPKRCGGCGWAIAVGAGGFGGGFPAGGSGGACITVGAGTAAV